MKTRTTKKKQLDLLLQPKLLKQSGLPDYQLLDFEQGVTTEISPYQCSRCEGIFKGLIEWVVHNRVTRTTLMCPTELQLQKHSLKKSQFKANGHSYTGWVNIPPVQSTGIKDEVLNDLYVKSFPEFNQPKG